MPQINIEEPALVAIRYIQLIASFIGGIGFFCGIFLFIYAFKNPLKRRLAFVLTVFCPILVLFSIHGVVFIGHYVFNEPAIPDEKGLYMFEPTLEIAGTNLYEAFTQVVKPLLVSVIIIGLGVLHHASRMPGRKRIGYGILVGVPVLWTLIEAGPTIFDILIS